MVSNSSSCEVTREIDDHDWKSDGSFSGEIQQHKIRSYTYQVLLMGINASQVNRLTVQTIYNTNNSMAFVTMHTSDMILTMKSISLYIYRS